MSKLKEFNEKIVPALEKEVEDLQNLDLVFSKLDKLVQECDDILNGLKHVISAAEQTAIEIENQTKLVRAALVELKTLLEDSSAEQKRVLQNGFKDLQQLLDQKHEELQKLIHDEAEAISEANKKFYNDFATTVQTLLEHHKMEIKLLIEEDSRATKQEIMQLESSFKEQLSRQKNISLIFGFVIIGLIIVSTILMFVLK